MEFYSLECEWSNCIWELNFNNINEIALEDTIVTQVKMKMNKEIFMLGDSFRISNFTIEDVQSSLQFINF